MLKQDGKCISFASRTLNDTEKNYSNIERELLTLVWACEKFDQYLRGLNKFELSTDHSPLVPMINGSNINSTPPRCQRLLMRLMRYNPIAKYVPGVQMTVADTLSQSPDIRCESDIKFTEEVESHFASARTNIPISNNRVREITEATQKDDILRRAVVYTIEGWPRYVKDVPEPLLPYYHVRSNLSVAENMLLYDNRIVIPETLQSDILTALGC